MLLSFLAHHPEAGDPDLLDWIKQRLDSMIALEPGVIVIGLGLFLVAIPAAILAVYVSQRRRGQSRHR